MGSATSQALSIASKAVTPPTSLTRSRLTSAPALAGALVVVTILAWGPLAELDESLQGYWAKKYTPNWATFLDQVPNAVAGQAVCLPVLLGVALWLARKHRTWHPLAIVAVTEAGFYGGIGSLKLLLGRTAPAAGQGHFWQGGVFEHGWYGIAYPSGHAAEAILIYGAAAYLLRTYAEPDWRITRRLNWLVGLITLNAVVVAFYLGFHWPSDLLAGLLAGALVLRLIVDADRAVAARRPFLGLHVHRIIPRTFHLPVPHGISTPRPAPAARVAPVSRGTRRPATRPAAPRPHVGAPTGRHARPSIRIGEPHTWAAPRSTRPRPVGAHRGGPERDRIAS